MPSIASINVRIGADIKNLQSSLGKAERSLQRTGARLSRLGNDISISLSAPLALLGHAAINSAGELESLKNAMASTMGSAEAAREEIEKLRKEALKPGLDFEQAIKGSVRLQAVGMNADQSRRALAAFGNALSLAGGTAEDLDGITLALTQISAKGKVSAEEINQLAERVPQIRMAMQDAFGTADTEVLQKRGIGAEKFIDGVVASLEKLPQAQTGIKNSMVNMFTAVRVALADFGEEIDKTLDLKNIFAQVGEKAAELAEWFRLLDKDTKKFIITAGAFIVALGPAVKILGALYGVGGMVVGAFSSIIGVIKIVPSTVLGAVAAFQKLDIAMKLTALGGLIAAVGVAVAAWQHFTSRVSEAKAAQEAVNDVQSRAAAAMAEEKVKVEQLARAVSDETKTENERLQALKNLQAISPEYFGNLEIEKGKIEGLNAAVESYLQLVEKRAKTQAANEKLVEIERELMDGNARREGEKLTFWQELAAASKGMMYSEAARAKTAKENSAQWEANLIAEKKAVLELIKMGAIAEEVPKRLGKGLGGIGTGLKGLGKEAEETKEDISQLLDELVKMTETEWAHTDNYRQNISPARPLDPLEGISLENLPVESLNAYADAAARVAEQNEAVARGLQHIAGIGGAMAPMWQGMSAAMTESANAGAASLKELGKAALKAAASFLRAKLIESVSSVMAKTFATMGPLGLAIAGGAGAAAGALFNRVIGALKIPALAQGGLAYAPTLAMVGDNRGAGADPEVIAPLSKLKGMLGGGGGEMVMTHRISGRDLLVVLERAKQEMERI